MSKFGDLLKNGNEEKQEEVEAKKANPFGMLKKAVARTPVPSTATAAAEVKSDSPSRQTSAAPAQASVGDSSPSRTDATSPDTSDVMLGVSGDFSESRSAREFQAEDQPDGYEEEHVNALKDSLDILVNSMDNKELVADALKKIMLDLKRYPFLVNILHPEDCNLMVRAVRESYGTTLAKKQVRQGKRQATSKEVDDVMDMLGDMEISI